MEAEKDIQRALTIPEDHIKADLIRGNTHWLYSRVYDIQLEEENSCQQLKKATQFLKSSYLYSTLALSEYELGRYEDALNNASRAIKMDNTNAYAYNNRALILLHFSEYRKAMNDVNKSIALDASNPYAFKHRALILIALKKDKTACDDLYEAERLDYENFQNEADADHVAQLIKKHCTTD